MHKITQLLRRKVLFALYGIMFFLVPVILTISFKNVANITAVLFILITILSFNNHFYLNYKKPEFYYFIIFLLYCFISLSWAENSETGLERLIKVSLLTGPSVLLLGIKHSDHKIKSDLLLILPISFIVAALLTIYQYVDQSSLAEIITKNRNDNYINDLNSSIVGLTILIWPILAYLNLNKKVSFRLTFISLLLLLIIIYLGKTDITYVALIFSVAAYYWIKSGGSVFLFKLIIIFSILLFITLPPLLYERISVKNFELNTENTYIKRILEPSHLHRIEIWDRCLELIWEKPFFGRGISASFNLPKNDTPSKYRPDTTRSSFHYPHNLFIQILIDYGLIGLCLFLLWINSLFNMISKIPEKLRPYISAAIISILTAYLFSFPIWRSWWITFILFIALFFKIILIQMKNILEDQYS